eukprot:679563-Alexandrium_andersonii.AAC.1
MRREFVARVFVIHRAGGSEPGETLGLVRHGRIHYRGIHLHSLGVSRPPTMRWCGRGTRGASRPLDARHCR